MAGSIGIGFDGVVRASKRWKKHLHGLRDFRSSCLQRSHSSGGRKGWLHYWVLASELGGDVGPYEAEIELKELHCHPAGLESRQVKREVRPTHLQHCLEKCFRCLVLVGHYCIPDSVI